MKCIPITLSALFVKADISVMEIEEVFDASITSELQISSRFLKISFLISKFSVAASITISEYLADSNEVEVSIFSRVDLTGPELMCLF